MLQNRSPRNDRTERVERFVQESPEGWLFHTSLWQAAAPGAGKDRSFGLVNGTPIAGIMTMSWKGATYYHAAASAQTHRDAGGNTLLVHESILRSRARGDQTFHLGPTPPREQVDEMTYLVGRFKDKFGGLEVPWRTASLFLWLGLATARRVARSLQTTLKDNKRPGLKEAESKAEMGQT